MDRADPVLTDELVLDLARGHVSKVERVTEVDESGGEARAYLVDTTIVVKTQRPHRVRPRTSLAKEAYLLDALAPALGDSIPKLLGYGKVDTAQGPVEYLCMTRIPGRAVRHANLDPAARRALLVELGKLLRILHATPVDSEQLPTEDDTAALRTRLETAFATLDIALPDSLSQPPVLLHSNPGPSHVFIDPATGRFTGLIDFGDSYRSHPALDLYRWPDPADRILLRDAYLDGAKATPEFDQIWTLAMIQADLTEIARASPHAKAAQADLDTRLPSKAAPNTRTPQID